MGEKRAVPQDTASELATAACAAFCEISAKEASGVEDAFRAMAEQIVEHEPMRRHRMKMLRKRKRRLDAHAYETAASIVLAVVPFISALAVFYLFFGGLQYLLSIGIAAIVLCVAGS